MSAKKKARKKKGRAKATRAKKTKRKTARKKTALRMKKPRKKKARARGRSETVDRVVFEPKGLGPRSGGQSGDLQGLREIETADSESVGELLEEGNAYEAEAVKGVEDARDPDEGEVMTEEMPEDDIPKEYRGGDH